MALSIEECFQVLAVSRDASLQEVKESYRDLAAVWHPDRFSGNPRLEKKATEKLAEINGAYETLVKFYDGQASPPAAPASPETLEENDPCDKAPSRNRGARPGTKFVAATVSLGAIAAITLALWVFPGLKNRSSPSHVAPLRVVEGLPKAPEPVPPKLPGRERAKEIKPSGGSGKTAPGESRSHRGCISPWGQQRTRSAPWRGLPHRYPIRDGYTGPRISISVRDASPAGITAPWTHCAH